MHNKIALNIRGVRFETYEETLSRFPNTLLGNPALRAPFCNMENKEYYFDRSHYIFDTILFFYQSGGILAKPDCIDDDEFQDELRFFGIIKDAAAIDSTMNHSMEMRRRLWLLLEYPKISIAGKIFACMSLIAIIVSTITYCLETERRFASKTSDKTTKIGDLKSGSAWLIFETVYAIWFSLEYMLRLFSHPNKRRFVISILGVVDLAAIIPFLIIVSLNRNSNAILIRVLRFLQIFRILKLTRYSESLQLLGRSLSYCKGQITLLLIFFSINCLACGSVLYWIEKSAKQSSENSIMDTMWYCVVSMTTVGYGDIVPRTTLGKIMGTVTILIGIVVLFHIFIPVYLSYFKLLYELSFLKQVERNELEKEQNNQSETSKSIKKLSDSTSVRKPRTSVTIARSPSICTKDAFSPARKQSVLKEESVMRKVKYDYLRKISVTEAPIDVTRKMSSQESSSVEPLFPSRSPIRKRFTLDSPNETEEINNVHFDFDKGPSTQQQTRGRRKAVIEKPNIFVNQYNSEECSLPKQHNSGVKSFRSISLIVKPSILTKRKYSSDHAQMSYLQVPRKSLSLQLVSLQDNDMDNDDIDYDNNDNDIKECQSKDETGD